MKNTTYKPLLIYTVGKVSSASIYYACKQEAAYHLYHVHYITPEKIKAQSEVADRTGEISADLAEAIEFTKRSSEYNGTIKIINLVREPIARTLSLFFANSQISSDDLALFSDDSAKWEHIRKVFLNYDRHTELEYWVRNEFEKFTGIDLYKSNYSAKYGWGRHTTRRFDILTMQCELDDETKVALLNRFLGAKIPQITHANSTSEKAGEVVGSIYKEFLVNPNFPIEYIDYMYSLESSRFFYTKDQLNAFKTRWSGLQKSK